MVHPRGAHAFDPNDPDRHRTTVEDAEGEEITVMSCGEHTPSFAGTPGKAFRNLTTGTRAIDIPLADPRELARVRDLLAQDGVRCTLEGCDVIIQADENGDLGHGIQLHCNTVH